MLKLQAIGHLGQDARTQQHSGKTVINFTVPHTEKYTDNEGKLIERTTWVSCSIWRDRDNVSQYFTKGKLVFVEGLPVVSTYKNKQGVIVPKMEMRVDNFQFLSAKKAEQQEDEQAQQDHSAAGSPGETEDDLPF